ncbi:unnamed protein product [Phytophthora lilii]|uniref:Unnamed protein product n=1 Tax=Phytophthora lilii TaxID=2077276 RepID=A0A9W6TG29_9STRA|nr:unnamed protein product [Phytophthora lilii]
MRSSAAATAATQAAENFRCLAFYAACEVASSVCAEGSTCRPNEANANETAAMQCIPNEMPSQKCVAGGEAACPTGWTCSDSTNLCVQSSSYVCYLPRKGSTEERTSIQLAKNSDGTYTAIEAIFQTLQIAANRHEAEMQRQNSSSASTSQDNTAQEAQSSTSPSTSAPSTTSPPGTSSPSRTLPPATSSPAMSSESSSRSRAGSDRLSQSSSLSRSSADLHGSSTSSLDSQAASSSTSTTGSEATQSSTLKMTLTKPVNGGVYSLSSTMLVEWQLALLSGLDPGINSFRVDFSADNGAFDTIATNVSVLSKSVQGSNVTAFQFEWDLADNTSWLCTTCVLRICALQVESGNLCLRSDGQTDNNQSSRRLQTTTVENSGSGDGITFRIVREAFECSCGLSHESFLLAAVVIGLCIPVVVLLAEPLVTFYRDRQVFGLFARRDGPARPMIAGYSAKSATHKGRAVLVLVLLALCVACGFVAAQITTTNFLTEKGAIIILWVVTFAIAVALGVLVYCTLVCLVLFSVRWWRERAWERREPSSLSEYRSSLLSDDDKMSSGSITSPQ